MSSGELSREFGGVIAEVHTGVPIAVALQGLSRSIQLPEVTRFVDQVTGALDRGSPLAEVLRAQAQDSREQAKRSLLEMAGKKEVAMLVPLVFLILPMTVLFAIFPGLMVLQTGF
jgi:tight adherence protein C